MSSISEEPPEVNPSLEGLEDLVGPPEPAEPAPDAEEFVVHFARAFDQVAAAQAAGDNIGSHDFAVAFRRQFPRISLIAILERVRSKPEIAAAEPSAKKRGRPLDPAKAGRRQHRKMAKPAATEAMIAAYCKRVGAIHKLVDAAKFNMPASAAGRQPGGARFGHYVLKQATGKVSKVSGYAYFKFDAAARSLNVSRRAIGYWAADLFKNCPGSFIVCHRFKSSSLIFPAYDGVPIHPKAPGYDAAKIAAYEMAHCLAAP